LGFRFGGYYKAIYNNYKINPKFPEGFFTGEVLKVDTTANTKKGRLLGIGVRPVPLTQQEARDYQKKDSIAAYKKQTSTWILCSILKTYQLSRVPYIWLSCQ
jgi:hypothetical protein